MPAARWACTGGARPPWTTPTLPVGADPLRRWHRFIDVEAGLAFAVRFDKAVEFIGRDPLLAARDADQTRADGRRLRCLTLDDPRVVCLGTEPVHIDDGRRDA